MSFNRGVLLPCAPSTARGESTKLSASKSKIVYCNGKTVIIRDLANPSIALAYSEHVQNTTVARISPSGYYCASGDASGTVRIWDIVGEDQVLKGEYKVISGKINDLEWDGESKRIIAVGNGREKFGHAFMVDTGSSTGEIIGHSKPINSVAIRHQRPFRAATAGDDKLIIFHQGAPYKYEKTIKTHTNFVQDVRYAPSGDHFVSVGSDAKIFIYDGKTGDTVGEMTGAGHKGTIFACTWSPDNKFIASASADCTVKLWDIETRTAITSWTLGSGVNHQQIGTVWSGAEDIVSLSMSGDLNIFDRRTQDKPSRILNSPQKAITSLALPSSGTFLAGTADGRVLSFSSATNEATAVVGPGHSNLISALAPTKDGNIASIGFDDRVREIEGDSFTQAATTTASQPKSIAAGPDGTLFVAELNGVEAIRSNQKVFELSVPYSPNSIGASGSLVAVGGEDRNVHLHEWDGKTLKEVAVLDDNKGVVSALAFSPNGELLASGDSAGKIVLFDVKERKVITTRWAFHAARINSLAFTSDSLHCASGSLDTHVYIYSVKKPLRNIAISNAVPGGVHSVVWLESDSKGGKLASAGSDACIRTWDVTFHT